MKLKSVRIIIGTILALLLIFTFLPAAPAHAARDTELDPEEGEIGAEVEITGTNFNPSTEEDDEYADVYFSNQEADINDDIDDEVTSYETIRSGLWIDEDGDFSHTFTVPDLLNDGDDDHDVTSGTYYIYATISDGVNPPVTDYSAGTVTVNRAPALTIDSVTDNEDGTADIAWTDDDPDDNPAAPTVISLYYDLDAAGYDGTLIVEGIEQADTADVTD